MTKGTDQMANLDIKLKVDASGLSCPMPIVKAAQAMKTVASGELIEVVATDPGSVKDFAAWAGSTGNALVESDSANGKYRYVLRH
jgi:tRNA 2-thiouridine synthesizing protein A